MRAAEALRRLGFEGALALVGAEAHLPYDRPPLSKQLLAGTWDLDRIQIRLGDDLDADLRLGTAATELDLGARHVVAGGEPLPFDGLVIATGARPLELPGTDLDGVFTLRTLEDCLAIKAELGKEPRVTVIGAGFIGSEVAATCRGLGLEVTVLDIFDLPLVRVLGPEMGRVCAAMHRDHGVDLRMGVAVEGFEGEGRVERVRLADGTRVSADVVVVGIGVRPAVDWLHGTGLELRDGVVCDATCAAIGADAVVAAGDVARWFNPLFAQEMRVEHWTNAAEQADHAAATLISGPGTAEAFAPVPYFWSDQYDTKLQLVGIPDGAVSVLEGSVDERRFVAGYQRDGIIVGALGFSQPRRLMHYRTLIADRAPFPAPA